MSDDQTGSPDLHVGGQPDAAPTGTTADGPASGTGGQADQTTSATPGQAAAAPGQANSGIERFLTLDDIEDEKVRDAVGKILGGKEKEMHAAFTKKTQALTSQKQKIEAYDAFSRNPVQTLHQIAQQYGLQVVDPRNQQGTGQAQTGQAQQGRLNDPNWQPQTWGEVFSEFQNTTKEAIISELIQKLAPVLNPIYSQVEKITSNHIEQQLDAIDRDWRIYEDDIKENMRQHPSLVKDPQGVGKLYRISVPDSVLSAKATQDALRKFENKAAVARQGSKSQVNTTAPSGPPAAGSTFQQVVEWARTQPNVQRG